MFVSNLHIKSFIRVLFILFLVFFTLPVNSFAQSKEVVAEKGDGIYSLLKRYGYSVSDNLNNFIALNKEQLGKDNSLIAGAKYKTPRQTWRNSSLIRVGKNPGQNRSLRNIWR
jgi:N-acetylmuramoyl-L-alanine amidase